VFAARTKIIWTGNGLAGGWQRCGQVLIRGFLRGGIYRIGAILVLFFVTIIVS